MSLCDRVLGVGKLPQLIVELLSSRVIMGRRPLAGCVLVYTLVKGTWRNLVIAAGLSARTRFSASVRASPLRIFACNQASNGSVASSASHVTVGCRLLADVAAARAVGGRLLGRVLVRVCLGAGVGELWRRARLGVWVPDSCVVPALAAWAWVPRAFIRVAVKP